MCSHFIERYFNAVVRNAYCYTSIVMLLRVGNICRMHSIKGISDRTGLVWLTVVETLQQHTF